MVYSKEVVFAHKVASFDVLQSSHAEMTCTMCRVSFFITLNRLVKKEKSVFGSQLILAFKIRSHPLTTLQYYCSV